MSGWYRRAGERWVLELHVQPGAARTQVVGLHDGRLKVRVAARAMDGRANAALVEFVAAKLGAAKRGVHIDAGATSRRKRVQVVGASRAPDVLFRLKDA